jgi:inhibitor of KinA sporulation pathway (predicted exonuclease)
MPAVSVPFCDVSLTRSYADFWKMNEVPEITLGHFAYLLVVDLEATCWADARWPRADMETIEFGSALVRMADLAIIDARSWLIRPRVHPELSAFCTELTGITQADVNLGISFERLYDELTAWLAPYREGLGWASWGNYDFRQLALDAARLGRESPLSDVPHVNLKKQFAQCHRIKGTRPSVRRAMQLCRLTFEGRPHRGVDDARNISRLLPWLLGRPLAVRPK